LENVGDIYLREAGKLGRRKPRSLEIDAVVDTGALMTLLPQDAVEALGLKTRGSTTVQLANDQKIELSVTEGLRLTVAGREMATDCLVGPPGCTALIGQIVMERLDLIADPRKRTLTPRPESPFRPTLMLKTAALTGAGSSN
jgi:clan AA aspartic protease